MPESANLRHKLGISRRDLLRRGAVVGGTLLWTVPVISSVSRAHRRAAHTPATGCCECRNNPAGPVFCPSPQSDCDTPSKCAACCRAAGHKNSKYHTNPGHDSISCVPGTGAGTGCVPGH